MSEKSSPTSNSFTLRIVLDNDAFHPEPLTGLLFCLDDVIRKLTDGDEIAFIKDSNGNRVGSYILLHTPTQKEPPMSPRKFNFYTPTQYDYDAKIRFHATVRSRFRLLLAHYPDAIIDTNHGGPAVSGETYLRTPDFIIEASQPPSQFDAGLRIYRFNPEGPNHFAPLSLLNNLPALIHHLDRFLNYKPHAFATAPIQLPSLPSKPRAAA